MRSALPSRWRCGASAKHLESASPYDVGQPPSSSSRNHTRTINIFSATICSYIRDYVYDHRLSRRHDRLASTFDPLYDRLNLIWVAPLTTRHDIDRRRTIRHTKRNVTTHRSGATAPFKNIFGVGPDIRERSLTLRPVALIVDLNRTCRGHARPPPIADVGLHRISAETF